jgi:hypothetical protein
VFVAKQLGLPEEKCVTQLYSIIDPVVSNSNLNISAEIEVIRENTLGCEEDVSWKNQREKISEIVLSRTSRAEMLHFWILQRVYMRVQ